MNVWSWLATCPPATRAALTHDSTITFSNTTQPSPSHNKHLVSDTSTPLSSSIKASDTNGVSLQSNLSLETLPSIPSLQKITPEPLHVTFLCTNSFKPLPQCPITCIASHTNFLYTASAHQINVFDRTTLALLDSFNGQDDLSGYVKSVSFCDGKIFTAHQDSKIRVWKMTPTKHQRMLTVLPTVNDRLRRFALPKNYVSVRRHKRMLWIEHADAVTGLAVNGDFIYSVSWDKTLKIWRTSDFRCLESIKAHQDAVNAVAVSTDGTVYTGSADRKIRVWAKPFNEKRHVLVATLEKHRSAVNALALSVDGLVLFSGACDRSIIVWNREDSANHMVASGALRGHNNAILCLTNVSDLLFSGSADRTVRIWQRRVDGKYCCLAVLEGHCKPVKSLTAVHEGGANGITKVFSGSLDGEVKVWLVSVSIPYS